MNSFSCISAHKITDSVAKLYVTREESYALDSANDEHHGGKHTLESLEPQILTI